MLEHEKALIEAILHDELVIDRCLVQSEFFTDPNARGVYEGILATRRKNVRIDPVSLMDSLRAMGRADLIAVSASFSPMSSANAAYYANKLRDELRRRQLMPIAAEAARRLADDSTPLDDIIKQLTDGLVNIQKSERATEDPSIQANFESYRIELERRNNDDGKSGAMFGLEELDTALGSHIEAGELVAIAARPGVGKTALAIQMALYNSIYRKIPSSIFSLEMTRNEIYDRIYAPYVSGGISGLRGGYTIKTKKTIDGLKDITIKMHEGGIRVFQDSMTPATLCANIRRDAMVFKTRLFVVDYLGLIDFGSDSRTARWEKVGEMSRMLKRLALDLAVSIIICVQLGRQADGKEPMLADLRDSGTIEQDCNRVLMIHRLSNDPTTDFEADVIIQKNRGGPRGRAHLMFIGASTRFERLERTKD